MKKQVDEINDYIEQLLVILDKDAEYLQDNIDQLNELRRLLIKHDVNALSQLLTAVQSRAHSVQENTVQRNELRQKLATFLGCSTDEITLSRIEKHLAVDKQIELADRKSNLQQLAGKLKNEYVSTQSLLADCTRFNRLLLKCLFENGQSANRTYKPTGTTESQANPVFMNVQF